MTGVKFQDHILEAIDQLRHRKARPDEERIYNTLFRRHAINITEAKTALKQCVESGAVLKVSYKGNISYRNAAKKFSHLKRDAQGEVIRAPGKPRRKFTALLTNAFTELVLHEPDYLEYGVPPPELIKIILAKDNVRYTKRYVSILLEKEVEAGGLVRMNSGNFLFGRNKNDEIQTCHNQMETEHEHSDNITALTQNAAVIATTADAAAPITSPPQTTSQHTAAAVASAAATTAPQPKVQQHLVQLHRNNNNHQQHQQEEHSIVLNSSSFMDGHGHAQDDRPNENLRVGGRRKRAKKVFDPSDNNLPKKRGRPLGSGKNQTEKYNNSSMSSRHSDGGYDSRPESRSSLNGRGEVQGGVCSVCRIQNKKGPNEKMISCRECSNKDVSRGTTPTNFQSAPVSPTPPTLSPQTTQNGRRHTLTDSDSKSETHSIKEEELEENIDPSIPDATNWSPEDVYEYFYQYFPDEAIVFKEQEIDGHSLLLMRRMDVLKGLTLKLGPALKIYRHVLKLQYRRDDHKLYWA
ncbi:PREDICTED: uncharacterized protein LOC108559155 isoform X5 [Nicrophorus vespilloides]|uniref:Uncharacterized protein LOC108559155 isoform X5 n=1 Tax=Nicrophorus vespilloides TaxID=110193 RepID=A0ABM1MB61_NICVS|nr:PREDICTED: uncharacterized protein LOC108559155 isoform X5 [Nicrophorus vespilloides]